MPFGDLQLRPSGFGQVFRPDAWEGEARQHASVLTRAICEHGLRVGCGITCNYACGSELGVELTVAYDLQDTLLFRCAVQAPLLSCSSMFLCLRLQYVVCSCQQACLRRLARPALSMYVAPDCEDGVVLFRLQVAVWHMVC